MYFRSSMFRKFDIRFFSRNIPNRSHKHFDTIMIKVILLGKPKGRLAHYHLSLYEIIIPKFCWHNGIKIF